MTPPSLYNSPVTEEASCRGASGASSSSSSLLRTLLDVVGLLLLLGVSSTVLGRALLVGLGGLLGALLLS